MKHELVRNFPVYGCSCGADYDYRSEFEAHVKREMQPKLPWWTGERAVTLIATREEILLQTGQPNPYGSEWDAIDASTYDASFEGSDEDGDHWKESGGRGWGATEQEAIDDLLDQILEEVLA
ncbi:MAG: hypothetical protein NVS9B14_06480 [Candidatus Acidiferrum sp.]